MVLTITPKIYQNSTQALKAYQSTPNNISVSNNYPNLKPLAKDSVSFTGIPGAGAKVSDFLEAQVAADTPRLRRIATTFLDVLESVASKLKENGFSMDRAYCEKNPVKKPDSYASKVVRSGSFKVPDAVRATLYCDQPYNLNNLVALLGEMEKRGYVLEEVDTPVLDLIKRGYVPTEKETKNLTKATKKVPDLDIRLEDVSDQVTILPERLRYSIGKPQKSGYEDIQMRFVRDFDTSRQPVSHELIVVFGPEYSKAKHFESSRVYGNLREFDELHADLSDKTMGSHAQKATRYIDLIQQMFRGKISEKLFINAKNKDLYQISDEVPITFSENDKKVFESYFAGLKDRINSVYSETRKANKGKKELLSQINKDARADRTLLEKLYKNLKETIAVFDSNNETNIARDK